MKIFFLRTDSSEKDRFSLRNGDLGMERVATVHAEILILHRGFSVKVYTNSAILEVDRCVQKHYLFS